MRLGTCPICGYDQIEPGAGVCDWCENPLRAEEIVWRSEYRLTPDQSMAVFQMLLEEYGGSMEIEFGDNLTE